jgi:hypothetical protein
METRRLAKWVFPVKSDEISRGLHLCKLIHAVSNARYFVGDLRETAKQVVTDQLHLCSLTPELCGYAIGSSCRLLFEDAPRLWGPLFPTTVLARIVGKNVADSRWSS